MGTVLVADDSLTIRTICQWVFKGTGHNLVLAESGDEAIQLARQHGPAVIVLDYTLPDHDSYELCRSIKSDPGLSRSAVLMLGGNHAQFDANRAASCGADGSLTKPFMSADFLGKIDELAGLAASGQVRSLAAAAPPPAPTPMPMAAQPVEPVFAAAQPAQPAAGAEPRARFQFPGRGAPAGGPKRFSFPSGPQGGPPSAPTPAEPTPLPSAPPMAAEPMYHYEQPAPAVHEHSYATPLPSPPPVAAPAAMATLAPMQAVSPVVIDENVVRAEVQAIVKEMLPTMVKTVLKELITKEVMPHLQRWVETKVESMVRNRFE